MQAHPGVLQLDVKIQSRSSGRCHKVTWSPPGLGSAISLPSYIITTSPAWSRICIVSDNHLLSLKISIFPVHCLVHRSSMLSSSAKSPSLRAPFLMHTAMCYGTRMNKNAQEYLEKFLHKATENHRIVKVGKDWALPYPVHGLKHGCWNQVVSADCKTHWKQGLSATIGLWNSSNK